MKSADVNAQEVTILRVGGEGGCLELVGVQDCTGWRFQARTNETALLDDLLDEDDASYFQSLPPRPWVRSWHEALDQLESYPWRELSPQYVEPAFRGQINDALRTSTRQVEAIDWERWTTILSDAHRMP